MTVEELISNPLVHAALDLFIADDSWANETNLIDIIRKVLLEASGNE